MRKRRRAASRDPQAIASDYCRAVLVSETVLVTAAHCVAPSARPPGVELRVDFSSDATPNDPGWFAPVAEVASPRFLIGPQGEIGRGLGSDIGRFEIASKRGCFATGCLGKKGSQSSRAAECDEGPPRGSKHPAALDVEPGLAHRASGAAGG